MSESSNLTTQTENSIEVPDTHSNDPLGIDQTVYEHVIDPSLILFPSVQQFSAVFDEEVLSDLPPLTPHRSTVLLSSSLSICDALHPSLHPSIHPSIHFSIFNKRSGWWRPLLQSIPE